MGLRLRGGASLELRVKINSEEIKVDIINTSTVLDLKEKIYTINKNLSASHMHLQSGGVDLENTKQLKDYIFLKNGVVVDQSKASLAKIPGLVVSYDPDCLGMSDDGEACAKMKCGHVISTASMTLFIRQLISESKWEIRCPAYKQDGKPCKELWDYPICR